MTPLFGADGTVGLRNDEILTLRKNTLDKEKCKP